MRIHILSDIHLEFAAFEPAQVEADVVVLAGDIHTGINGIKWILQSMPNRPVIYVLGNHEFYGQKLQKLLAEVREMSSGTNVHVLEDDRIEIGNVVFLGATLWTDFRLNGDPVVAELIAQTGMNDFRRIRTLPAYRRFRPRDARALHAGSLSWLRSELGSLRGRNTVVVTHHAPSPKSIPSKFHNDALNPAFASNLEPFIEDCGAELWIHGHIHHHADYTIGGTRVIANPRGYPSETHTGFNPALVVEV